MADTQRDAADLAIDPPTRSKSGAGKWIALGCGGAFLLAFLCCGGGALFLWFGFEQIESNLLAQLRENTILVEHVGEVRELSVDWPRTIERASDDVFVYRVEGSAGSGWIAIAKPTIEAGGEEIHSAELLLPSGERIDLYPPLEPSAGEPTRAPSIEERRDADGEKSDSEEP